MVVKLDKASYLGREEICELMLNCKNGFQAKQLKRNHSIHHWINLWHNIPRSNIFDILISAAFIHTKFLSCLMLRNSFMSSPMDITIHIGQHQAKILVVFYWLVFAKQ